MHTCHGIPQLKAAQEEIKINKTKNKLNQPHDFSGGIKIKINMETKIITIRRTVEIALSVPVNETQDDVERWAIRNLVPDCLNTESEIRHWISDVRFIDNDDEDQDSFVVVSWPESQELCEHVGFQDNCTFIMGDSLPSSSYLVNKAWYSRLCNGELRKIEDFDVNEEVLCSYGV